MQFSRRRLMTNGTKALTAPGFSNAIETAATKPAAVNVLTNISASQSLSRRQVETREEASKSARDKGRKRGADANIETADMLPPLGGGTNTVVSETITNTYLMPLLAEIIPDYHANLSAPSRVMYDLYRDIYYHDTISGSAVDMKTSLAFSDFNLTGLDDKQLQPFMDSIDNIKVRRLLPQLSTMFLVNGMYVAQTPWLADKKAFKSIIPHNPGFVHLDINPTFGVDPTVRVDFASALALLRGASSNRRGGKKDTDSEEVKSRMPEGYNKDGVPIPENELVYMTRKGQAMDVRGLSYFKRVLPIWLMEKAMMRGTLDQATKRQRGIPHLQVGEEDWVPTAEEMGYLAKMLADADLDPVGATFVTRRGVDVSEIMQADSFWKYPDIYDFASQAKMRALGINEAVLSGDATIATMDTALSIFVEDVRDHRDTITYELFYERMFPRIAVENDIRLKKKQKGVNPFNLETSSLDEIKKMSLTERKELLEYLSKVRGQSAFESASSYEGFDSKKHAMPAVNWHKRLRPEADQTYLEMLSLLAEKGLPIPLQMWAAAGGMDIDLLMNGLSQDVKHRTVVKEWRKRTGVTTEEDNGNEEASTTDFIPMSLMERDFEEIEEAYGVRNMTSDGKYHPLSAKGRAILTEKVHKTIAEAAANVSKRINYTESLRNDGASSKTYSIATAQVGK